MRQDVLLYILKFVNANSAFHYAVKDFRERLINQRTKGPVNAHLSLLHIPINMFEYYGI